MLYSHEKQIKNFPQQCYFCSMVHCPAFLFSRVCHPVSSKPAWCYQDTGRNLFQLVVLQLKKYTDDEIYMFLCSLGLGRL